MIQSVGEFIRYFEAVRRRTWTVVDRLTPELADLLVQVAGDAESVVLPWVPDAYDVRAGDAWGGSPVRRLASLLLTWTNLAATMLSGAGDHDGATRLLATKRGLSAILDEADTHGAIGSIDDLLLQEMAALPGQPYEALVLALERWADADDVDHGLQHGPAGIDGSGLVAAHPPGCPTR